MAGWLPGAVRRAHAAPLGAPLGPVVQRQDHLAARLEDGTFPQASAGSAALVRAATEEATGAREPTAAVADLQALPAEEGFRGTTAAGARLDEPPAALLDACREPRVERPRVPVAAQPQLAAVAVREPHEERA